MSNTDAAFGLRPVRMLNGGKIPCRKYLNDGTTTAIFKGDIVVMCATGKVLRLANTSSSDDIVGAAANYVAAGTSGQDVWVYDDPFTIFEVQSDGTTAAAHGAFRGSVGVAIVTAGSTTTGQSIVELDYSSITSTGTASNNLFKIVGVGKGIRNDSAASHAVMEVTLIRHLYTYRSASV